MARNVIGSKVRQARKGQSPELTQVDLASRLQIGGLNINQATVSKIENGTRAVTDVELVGLAKALGISVGWLVSEAE